MTNRHMHSTKLLRLIQELREWVGQNTGTYGAHGHRSLSLIVADALSVIDDEMAAIDAAARDATVRRHAPPKDHP